MSELMEINTHTHTGCLHKQLYIFFLLNVETSELRRCPDTGLNHWIKTQTWIY